MATKPKTGTAIANYDEELARQAEAYAKQEESSGGAQFFSVQGGILTFAGAAMPNNEIACVITDAILENVYYEGLYDSKNPQPPMCYAFGRDDKEMEPHANVVEQGTAQCESCSGCEFNEFGSAPTGRGKACKNTRRLVLLPAGTLDDRGKLVLPDDPEEYFESAGFGFFRLPVTSVKGYANFVKQVAGALRLPPHGIFTKIQVVPDADSQFKVLFSPLGAIQKDLLPYIMQRHQEAMSIIETPYPAPSDEPAPPPRAAAKGGRAAAKPAPKAAAPKRTAGARAR